MFTSKPSSTCCTGQAFLVLVLVLSCSCRLGWSLEQDAQLLRPLASLVKSITSLATSGSPTPIEFSSTDMARNMVSFVFRTGFPLTVPRDFINNTQNFLNRLVDRVYNADASQVSRKTLASLKRDMDDIVDSVVEEVGQSNDGLYTDYLRTQVNGRTLEQALTDVGVQLKAYGIDLKNYRDLASAVLGLPLMPELGAAASSVASLTPTSVSALTDVTSRLIQTGAQMPGFAINAITSPIQSMETIRQRLPIPIPGPSTSFLMNPFSLFAPPSQPSAGPAQPIL